MNQSVILKRGATIATISFLLASCAGVPQKDEILQNARAAYAKVENNPDAQNLASLYDAEHALKKAEGAETAVEMEHLAYLAEKQAEITLAMSETKGAQLKRDDLTKQQDEARLSAREREILEKQRQADMALDEAERARQEAQRLAEKNQSLEQQLSELQGKQTDKGLVLTLGDVLFETGKADLLSGALQQIDKIAIYLSQATDRNVLVEGHTDNVGSDEYNMGLSERRANSVRFALVERGVASNRILSKGYGKSRPVAENNTDVGRQQNRRVEITILNEGISLPTF
jgi:outer membrane protein OmpA-like peptidoglycan-associated protein